MYNVTRQEASIILNVSKRSIDRYIKSGKLRSKKEGKIIYINSEDINKLKNKGNVNQEIIIGKKSDISINSKIKETNENNEFIYNDLKKIIEEKDKKIENLTYNLAKLEENLKNSITLIEFKKSQFLLEQSKESLEKDLEIEKNKNKALEEKLIKENKINMILFLVSVIIFILLILVWFIKI